MSKILVITNRSYMLYRFRLELLCKLAEAHEVVLSMPFVGHEEDFQALGFRCIDTPVDRRGINPVTDWKLLRTYRRLIKKESPDLVITYSIKPNIYAGLVCRQRGIPYCANVQGLGSAFERAGVAQLVTLMYRVALKRARTVFFENDSNAEAFLMRKILTRDRLCVLHGAGINLEKYPLQPYPANPCFRFLYLGRIMREKGMDELFAAVRRLHAEGLDFRLDLVGFFEDEYRSQVEELSAAGIVCDHGFQEDPALFYGAADCVVLPSYHEGMSNVLLEAAATGRPLITTDIPGCREAVERNVSGLLVHARDADSLTEAMRAMYRLPAAEREAMGLAGRQKMEAEFRKETVVAETIRALGL